MLVALAAPAAARTHGFIALGSLGEATAPAVGGWVGGDLWPGGKWGARADLYLFEFEHWLVEASAVRQLGATRPHLVMSLHFGGGYAEGDLVTLSCGLATQLGLRIGPLALVSDATGHVAIGDGTWDLLLTGTLGLAAAF